MAAPTKDEVRAEVLRLMPSWAREPDEILDAIVELIAAQAEKVYAAIETMNDRRYIGSADGEWLDEHGRERAVPRFENESDDDYRERVLGLEDKVTRAAILAGVDRVLESGTSRMEEHRRDGLLLSSDPSNVSAQAFLGLGRLYDRNAAFTVFIPAQSQNPALGFLQESPTNLSAKAYLSEDPGPASAQGVFLYPGGLAPNEAYTRARLEIERLRGVGIGASLVIE